MSTRILYSALALVVVAGLLWSALALARPMALDVGARGDSRFLGGFYDPEAGEGASFRWSGPRARLVLHGAPAGAALLGLRLSGERLAARGEPGLALTRGETTFASFDVAPGWRVYRVLLPAGAAAAPWVAALPIDLQTAVSRPGVSEEARDYRALGVPLDQLWLAPAARSPSGALPRALWLTWAVGALALLVGMAAGALARVRGASRPGGGGLHAALILALGAGLGLWAWRDPYGLAWALPATPWALGAATVCLGLARLPVAGGVRPEVLAPVGLAALAAGVGLMHAHLAIGAGLALAVAGLLALVAEPGGLLAAVWDEPGRGRPGPGPAVSGEAAAGRGRPGPGPAGAGLGPQGAGAAAGGPSWAMLPGAAAGPLLALACIFGLALALRLLWLDQLPFGLWRDEARHGLVALRMVEDPTYRPAYVLDERVHLPGLGLYPFAAALRLFGVHLWSLRTVTALAGALTVLPLYALGARLSGRPAVGLGAALLLAGSSWHLSISRLAFPTVFEPLLSLTACWLLLLVLDGGPGPRGPWRLLSALGAGALLGAAAQTYHTGRVMPLAAVWLCLLLLPRARRGRRAWLAVVGAAAAGFALVVAPLVAYAIARPGDFNDRVGDVFLLSAATLRGRAPLAALDANLGRHLLMFTAEGDANGRHHAPLRPLLDIVTGAGLLLGLAALLRRLDDWRSRFLLGTLALGLLPGLLAVDAPHAMRTFGAVAPACLIAALGLGLLLRARPRPLTEAGPGAGLGLRPASRPLLVALGAVAIVGLNAWLYFGVMPGDPQVFLGFYPVQSRMGAYVRESAGGEPVYVPREVREHPTFAFLASGLPVEIFEGAAVSAPPAPGAPFLLSGYFAADEAAGLTATLGPAAAPAEAGPEFPDGRGPTFFVYRAR